MNLDEIDTFLTSELGLLVDPGERGNGKTYFWKKVAWLPSESTRVARILWTSSGEILAVQLCVSSDNNNSVLVRPPIEKCRLRTLVLGELASLEMKGRGLIRR
jgi:hypothetical protein